MNFSSISDDQIIEIMECDDVSTARIKLSRLIHAQRETSPTPQAQEQLPEQHQPEEGSSPTSGDVQTGYPQGGRPDGTEREQRVREAVSVEASDLSSLWSPFETAPKDGTEIIAVFCSDYGYQEKPTVYGPYTIRWADGEWVSSWDGCRVVYSQTDFGTTYHDVDIPHTHWMPLPAAPKLEV